METKFCLCRLCGNLVGVINDGGVPMMCCGEKMETLMPNTAEGAGEKHLPVVDLENDSVRVNIGKVSHPMEKDHSIEWVYLHTDRGGHRKNLLPGDKPPVSFTLDEEKPTAVYAYCNRHGLWKTEI